MTQVEKRREILFESGELLTLDEILEKTKFSKTYIYASMKNGRFPRSIKFSTKTVRWPSDDVNKWFEAFINGCAPAE
ncbi:helix-turn-helix transcriptional regulator [Saccharibacter floricola]|uniref:AlpA family phage regulatory protein n=1 Tax=Saccharibacter floricola DSM 15669 TaxID=1123227 RepID=A0ABQ0P1F6_9PROT|nr:AlpA family phage regulatory protein [Saccharibacter floricola]GBQ09052.1 hypothetical protein AA15669_2037 [Saccharibacter floricola DSM 15669]